MRTWQSDIALYVRPPLPLFVAPILFYMLPILVSDITDLIRKDAIGPEVLNMRVERQVSISETLWI